MRSQLHSEQHRSRSLAPLALVLVTLATPAPGQEEPAAAPVSPPLAPSAQAAAAEGDPTEELGSDDEDERDSFRWTRFRLKGRVLGRWQSVRQDGVSESEFDLENARITLDWRPARWLQAQVEYDAAMNHRERRLELPAPQWRTCLPAAGRRRPSAST